MENGTKAVLISIKPYWVFLILAKAMGWNIDKEKTVEVRKNYPKDEEWNKVAKIYCSNDKKSFSEIPQEYQPVMERFLGKVIGEFVCDQLCQVLSHPSVFAGHPLFFQKAIDDACLTQEEVEAYGGGKDVVGWVISELKIYDKPKVLSDFGTKHKCNLSRKCTEQGFLCAGYCKLTRPPQSWCYVEELKDG